MHEQGRVAAALKWDETEKSRDSSAIGQSRQGQFLVVTFGRSVTDGWHLQNQREGVSVRLSQREPGQRTMPSTWRGNRGTPYPPAYANTRFFGRHEPDADAWRLIRRPEQTACGQPHAGCCGMRRRGAADGD